MFDLALHRLVQGPVQRLDLVERPVERSDRVRSREKRQRQRVAGGRVVCQVATQGGVCQQLRVAQGIGNTVGSQRVLEVASIADQRPARTASLPQKAVSATKQ